MQILYVIVNSEFHEYCYKEFGLLRITIFLENPDWTWVSPSVVSFSLLPLFPPTFECI